MSRRLTCVLFLISLCQCASGALLAVDYGSEWVKASVVAPGRAPVSIVLNEASKRKQAAAVSLSGGERTVGDEALALATRYPERVYLRARDMLGRPANSSALAQHLQALYLPYAPLLSVPSRGTVALRTSEAAPGRDSVSAEELCGSVLQHVQRCAQDGLPPGAAPIRDAVLTVPPFWSQAQRLALLDCAALAGLNVLSLASEPAAAALQYGIDREPPPNSTQQLVVIVDVGAGSSSASLVAYSGWKARESTAKSKPHGQFEIKAVSWDETAGAEALDVLLAEHFAVEANAKLGSGVDVRDNPRSMSKLKRQCKRTKEILSANAEASISVEALHGDFDFRSSITREAFEKLGAPVFARCAEPLRRLLAEAGLQPADVAAVEVIGGGTRIPGVQAALVSALKGRPLDKHLDADETLALGAGLLAANLSTTFRMRRYGASDAAPFALTLTREGSAATLSSSSAAAAAEEVLDGGEEGEEGIAAGAASPIGGGGGAAASQGSAKVLLPKGKRLPARRVVSYSGVSADFAVTARYDAATLPPAVKADGMDNLLAGWSVSNVAGAVSKLQNSTGKVTLTFTVGRDAILVLDKAELGIEYLESYDELVPVNSTSNSTSNSSSPVVTLGNVSGSANASNATSSPPPPPATMKVKRTRVRASRVPLTVTLSASLLSPLSGALKASSLAKMGAMRAEDDARAATGRAKSGLEAYVIRLSEALDSDPESAEPGSATQRLLAVTAPAQRSAFLTQLESVEEWVYGDGADADAMAFTQRLQALRRMGDPMELRAQETLARPAAAAAARELVKEALASVASWPTSKPQVNATELKALSAAAEGLQGWLSEREGAQARKRAHEDAAFTAADVGDQSGALEALLAQLKRKPVPKPPKLADNATAGNGTRARGNATAAAEDLAEPEAPLDEEPAPLQGSDEAGEPPAVHDELR